MVLSLHNLKSANGSVKRRKRIGRGNASGHGTYSTRGLKGQRSRTGGSNKLKRLGFKKILQSLPKNRGFKSLKSKSQTINLIDLNRSFSDGAKITPLALIKLGLINKVERQVKILGGGELKIKNLQIENIKTSGDARAQIEKLGGKIT